MKIAIDLRCLVDDRKTGVEEYARKATLFLIEKNPHTEFILFFNSFKKNKIDLEKIKKIPNVKVKYFHYPNKILNLLFCFFNWPKIDKLLGGVDIAFMPNINFISLSKKVKLILVVHDLSFERFPEFFSIKRRLWHFLINSRRLCQKANEIWAVSNSTKDDIEALYKINQKKIKIVYPPFDKNKFSIDDSSKETFLRKIRKKYGLPEEFLLFFGTIEPRKNVISVIKSFDEIKKNKQYDNLCLVISGAKGWLLGEAIEKIQKSKFSKKIILTDFVEEKDKSAIYAMAKILLFPSFFEGFGYPPLEAMSLKTPVITSNCSSLPEITRKGAILIDPYRHSEITQAVITLLRDSNFQEKYIKRGQEAIEKFSFFSPVIKLISTKK